MMRNKLLLILVCGLMMLSDSEYSGQVITLDSIMNFINETSEVYKPSPFRETPQLLISTEEVIENAGYPVEVHRIFTEDGQMITLHRIHGSSWRGSNIGLGQTKQPVLMMHGFLGSSQIWLQYPAHQALPYILADAGFDVWMGNYRTNYYSRYHAKYSTKDKRFWDISFHEMGMYDLPAMVDHVLETTRSTQLMYIGHSMGTTTFLTMASIRPEYNSKITAAVLLSPVALTIRYTEFTSSIVSFLFANTPLLYKSLYKLGLYEIFPRNEHLYRLLYSICSPGPLQNVCLDLIGQGYGDNRENLDQKEFGTAAVSIFAGTSVKVGYHLAQLYLTGEFRMFDYGLIGNVMKYGRSIPPDYPLDRVTAPIYMYYGLNDPLMTTRSVKRLAAALPNVLQVTAVADPKFTHLDFLFGSNAKEVLYDPVVSLLNAIRHFKFKQDQLI